jgi:acyl-coenzyme A synthetase/AMP-(fatty) acid ligase
MIPERVHVLQDLPRTTTGKIDYRTLAESPEA